MKYVPIIALFVSALIHLVPVSGVAGDAALTKLYGIEVVDPNISILLQHRALLFGALGGLMLVAIALPSIRLTVLAVGLFSTVSFIVVAMWVGRYNPAIAKVVVADILASALLAAGLFTELYLAFSER